MKKIICVFLALLTAFFVTWTVKAGAPINRPDNVQEEADIPWYEQGYSIPVASDDWKIDPEIPINYIPVPGEDELYMVVNSSGNIEKYMTRTKQADGSWQWKEVNPDIPDTCEAVPGLENVYKVTNDAGVESYYLYVRNEDDTYCFVPCDKNGTPLSDGADANEIGKNYVHVSSNTYALYNDDGVLEGYRERVKTESGDYIWKVTAAPTLGSVGNADEWLSQVGNVQQYDASDMAVQPEYTGNTGSSNNNKTTNSDGTYTMTEHTKETQTKDGYKITYETTVYFTYDKDGNLLSTKKDGPYEISREEIKGSSAVADPSRIAGSIDAELARISTDVTFNNDTANELYANLNASRVEAGVSPLSGSDAAQYLAMLRAADMANFDNASSTSPLYGTLADICARFGINAGASENIWKTSPCTASDINLKFQANDGSRNLRTSNAVDSVGIAVVEKNGMMYVAEVYLSF